jgi:ubiquinone/menaquinone biosynthesis C-methylase UbiE
MVEISRKLAGSFPQIVVKQGDILDIDLPDKSMDIVLCSLTIHHFSDQDAVQLLKTMARISRIGIIVNDLQRNWIAASSAWLYTHLTTRNPLTLNDAYVSVRRAFTPQELTKLADSAGFRRFTVSCEPLFRLVLAGEP